MTINVKCKTDRYQKHILYVLGFLNEHPLLAIGTQFVLNSQNEDLVIHYGESTLDGFCIPPQELIFENKVIYSSDLVCNEFSYKTESLYAVESAVKPSKPFLTDQTFGFDIFETIFFHISRYEEYHCPLSHKDEWDMMWENHQILVREKLYHLPVVDLVVHAFFNSLGLETIRQKTVYSLSHDIDVIQKFKTPIRVVRSSVRALLDNGVSGFLNHLTHIGAVKRNTQKDPYDTFEFLLIDSSTNHFEEQILYLMTGGLTNKDNYYQINDEKITSVISKARQLGYNIGLHGSYATHQDGGQFNTEKAHLAKTIGKAITANRQHFLHFDFEHTPRILENAGIKIDSTLGYQRLIGFRCGTGFRYRLFDFKAKRAYSWMEQPMVIMDGALLAESGNDLSKAEQLFDQFLTKNNWNTHITLNVHNTIFDPSKRDSDKMKALYYKMVSIGE